MKRTGILRCDPQPSPSSEGLQIYNYNCTLFPLVPTRNFEVSLPNRVAVPGKHVPDRRIKRPVGRKQIVVFDSTLNPIMNDHQLRCDTSRMTFQNTHDIVKVDMRYWGR